MAWELPAVERRTSVIAMEEDPDLQAIVKTLARYLSANPMACDSLQGIRRWWFEQEYQGPEYRLDNAARWMKEHQLIEELVGSDGRVRYRRIGSDEQLRTLLFKADHG